ncbi:MAG: ATP-binding cassette domain-containing protein [Burkholderiaceae bacterium]|nr:ATP-binding cassette domain-containing protein [Burkholderiaceae bacterium]
MRDLPVLNNVFLGSELLTRNRLLDKTAVKERTRQLLANLKVTIDPEARVEAMSAAGKQMVEICKALAFEANVLIMDEPTTMLTKYEIEILFSMVTELSRPRG